MNTIIFNCTLEPEDTRNTTEIEITQMGLSIFNTHIVYLIKDRIKYAFQLLLKGINAVDVILGVEDTIKLSKFLNENIDAIQQLKEGQEKSENKKHAD